ncbi:MAG: S-layer homology domain-containing protein [Armatimonadetes bacterium]|nr:S-layer homology domain-containing protein [Armatimonadota bacterium]
MAAPFPDTPAAHWALDAVNQLAAKGLLEGYPGGTFRGDRAATRYEVAMVVARIMAKIEKMEPPDMSKYATKQDLAALRKLINEFRDELDALGVRVAKAEDKIASLEARVTELERVKVSGKLDTVVTTIGIVSTNANNINAAGNGAANGAFTYDEWGKEQLWYRGAGGTTTAVGGVSTLTIPTPYTQIWTGTALTSNLNLGVTAKLGDGVTGGIAMEAYSRIGSAPIAHYWGTQIPVEAATGAAVAPYAWLYNGWVQQKKDNLTYKATVGTFYPVWMTQKHNNIPLNNFIMRPPGNSAYRIAGRPSKGIFNIIPGRMPWYGAEVAGKWSNWDFDFFGFDHYALPTPQGFAAQNSAMGVGGRVGSKFPTFGNLGLGVFGFNVTDTFGAGASQLGGTLVGAIPSNWSFVGVDLSIPVPLGQKTGLWGCYYGSTTHVGTTMMAAAAGNLNYTDAAWTLGFNTNVFKDGVFSLSYLDLGPNSNPYNMNRPEDYPYGYQGFWATYDHSGKNWKFYTEYRSWQQRDAAVNSATGAQAANYLNAANGFPNITFVRNDTGWFPQKGTGGVATDKGKVNTLMFGGNWTPPGWKLNIAADYDNIQYRRGETDAAGRIYNFDRTVNNWYIGLGYPITAKLTGEAGYRWWSNTGNYRDTGGTALVSGTGFSYNQTQNSPRIGLKYEVAKDARLALNYATYTYDDASNYTTAGGVANNVGNLFDWTATMFIGELTWKF